ncbi:hypothetical protein REIFOR_01512 [Reinekea forsetii]|uniref:Uncharacterized protein n=1 Tax=Reinekea forsetii TaxID=1336806 RepID=A0A2K8KPF3_9GAMM|nr:hypothetical protein REIFOR_01512 [Reinekea forsetii]
MALDWRSVGLTLPALKNRRYHCFGRSDGCFLSLLAMVSIRLIVLSTCFIRSAFLKRLGLNSPYWLARARG